MWPSAGSGRCSCRTHLDADKIYIDTVKINPDSVKICPKSPCKLTRMTTGDSTPYHHGDLPTALKEAAVEVLIERGGPSNFSLREVARRAGVSHAAPAHHFQDKTGLLSALAADGYEKLAGALADARASSDDAAEQLTAAGHAYVRVAREAPAHYTLMVGCSDVDFAMDNIQHQSLRAYGELHELVAALRDQYNPNLDVDSTATFIWASVHGLVELSGDLAQVAESAGTSYTRLEDLIERLTDLLIDGIRHR